MGATCIGDGGTSTGAFHEGMNFAAVEKLPLVVIVANNQYAYSTPASKQFACKDLVDKAVGYGIRGPFSGRHQPRSLPRRRRQRRGTRARRRRPANGGRFHPAPLPATASTTTRNYVDPKLKQSSLGQDCLKLAENFLLEQAWADSSDIEAWRRDATHQVEEAVATAQREPAPDPGEEDWCPLATRHLSEGYIEES